MSSAGTLRATQLAAVITTLAERPGLTAYVLCMHVPVPQPGPAGQARTGCFCGSGFPHWLRWPTPQLATRSQQRAIKLLAGRRQRLSTLAVRQVIDLIGESQRRGEMREGRLLRFASR
jgi:hypothetical protein